MWLTRRCVVLLLLPMTGGATEPPAPNEATPSPTPAARRWYYLTRMEATTLALLPRAGVGSEEGFVPVEPTVVLVRPGFEALVVAGWGGRPGEGGAWAQWLAWAWMR